MKFSILQQDLLPVLQSVSRSCGVKATLPVLANILISAQGSKLHLSATNLEIGVIKIVNAEVETEGEVTVPSRTFLEIVSSLSNEKLEIEVAADQLKISTAKFSATLNVIPATEFPTIPLSGDKGVMVDGKVLSQVLPQISFAAAADEGRPILTGILTEIKKGVLEMVATDGFRLAHQTATLEGSVEEFKALIPRKSFEEVARLILEEGEVEKIGISTSDNQNQVIFKINQTSVSSRLIEGQFPAWEKIIPTTFQTRAILERQELLKAVKLASVFAKDSSNIVEVKTSAKNMKISSSTKELGSQESEIEADVSGEEMVIAFNGKFLVDALTNAPSAQISMEFSGALSPVLIKPLGLEGLEYVVMPVRRS
jgi:DNA polymerase III subunit beta